MACIENNKLVSKGPVGRFAPSPTGRMHAGNVFAALMSWLIVKSQGGSIVLRIEDLDRARSRQEYADQIMRDFEMLGLTWDRGPFYQQGRDEAYNEAFQTLDDSDLVYPCFCTRADLHAASAPHRGEKLIYPGTCATLTSDEVARRSKERSPAWRVRVPGQMFVLDDLVQGHYEQVLDRDCGDFVVRRSDGLFAYQLASVVDDAAQGVTCIVRGVDLLVSTPQQMFLQSALKLPSCTYAHVPLIVAERDRRLSKRDQDASLDELISRHGSAAGVIGHIASVVGLTGSDEPLMPADLLATFNCTQLPELFSDRIQIQWR